MGRHKIKSGKRNKKHIAKAAKAFVRKTYGQCDVIEYMSKNHDVKKVIGAYKGDISTKGL